VRKAPGAQRLPLDTPTSPPPTFACAGKARLHDLWRSAAANEAAAADNEAAATAAAVQIQAARAAARSARASAAAELSEGEHLVELSWASPVGIPGEAPADADPLQDGRVYVTLTDPRSRREKYFLCNLTTPFARMAHAYLSRGGLVPAHRASPLPCRTARPSGAPTRRPTSLAT